jgi:hypothetical protein
VLFSAGPHSQVRELSIDVDDVQAAVSACPAITALTINGGLAQEDFDFIFDTCKSLQRLCVRTHAYRAVKLSFTRLGSSPCAQSLTSFKSDAQLVPEFVKTICRCCPAIEELFVRDVGPVDVRAMASLMRLRVLHVVTNRDQDQGPEFSEAFTVLGNADGATPFTKLVLESADFDATGLFSSRRCNALRRLELFYCDGLTKQAMQALATNVRDSLEVLVSSSTALVVPLLAECCRLEYLVLQDYNVGIDSMRAINKTCKAPLRFVDFARFIKMSDAAVGAVSPALAGVVSLSIDCSVVAVLRHIVPRCPHLQTLQVNSLYDAEQLRAKIPKIAVYP